MFLHSKSNPVALLLYNCGTSGEEKLCIGNGAGAGVQRELRKQYYI